MARQLGATRWVLASANVKTAEEIRRLVPGGVNCAFDTTGRADSYQQSLASLATKGRFGFVTVPAGAFEPNLAAMMLGGLSIRGIVQGDSVPDAFIPRLIDLHMSGRFPFDKLVTRYPFEQINQAIEDQASGRVVKPVFTFSSQRLATLTLGKCGRFQSRRRRLPRTTSNCAACDCGCDLRAARPSGC
jgi:aryl-alcohol dehydrogenase